MPRECRDTWGLAFIGFRGLGFRFRTIRRLQAAYCLSSEAMYTLGSAVRIWHANLLGFKADCGCDFRDFYRGF